MDIKIRRKYGFKKGGKITAKPVRERGVVRAAMPSDFCGVSAKFPPEHFISGFSPKGFFGYLTEKVTTHPDIDFYIDTNHLDDSGYVGNGERCKEGLVRLYRGVMKFLDDERYKTVFRRLREKMVERTRGIENLVEQPNVVITNEVLEEVRRARDIVADFVKLHGKSEGRQEYLIEPLENAIRVCSNANIRTKETEEDPLVRRIAGIIPTYVLGDNPGQSSQLSETDKKIIAFPLASGLTDGRRKVILSYDYGVKWGVVGLRNILIRHPRRLDTGDLVEAFSQFMKVSLSVGNMDRIGEKYRTYTYRSYDDFFAVKRMAG